MEEELMHCLMGHKMSTSPSYQGYCDACARSSTGEAMYYSCNECNIIIHRKCAQLPKQINHPMHAEHPLLLRTKKSPGELACQCQVCKEEWRNFAYHCSSCDFDIDILCAFLEDDDIMNIMIPTHHHPMRLIRRPATFRCNAGCGIEKKDDESYLCTKPSCGFWVHKRCGSLPELFKRPDHDHPLQLAVRMPHRYRKYNLTCEICPENFKSNVWIYYCQLCKYFYHINCIENMSLLDTQIDNINYGYPPKLVMIREMKTVIEHNAEPRDNRDRYNDVTKAHLKYMEQEESRLLPGIKVDSHTHSLLLINDHTIDDDVVICDGCIAPIDRTSAPYYKCINKCNYFLHNICANLPKYRFMAQHMHGDTFYSPGSKSELYFPNNPWEAFQCMACKSLCNGYGYKCTSYDCEHFYLDVKCNYLTGVIKHIGHPTHNLTSTINWYLGGHFSCKGCGLYRNRTGLYFYCGQCYFAMCYECATLPATVTHRWDQHPLVLSFPPFFRNTSSDADDNEFYCEVCEKEIHPKRWMYRCTECDQSFHPRCIPTLGECRNIKFGKTFRIQSHPHPLTSIPQAKLTSKCYYCRKSLNWIRAFECAPCGFYLCFDCIPKEKLVEE